MSIIPKDKVWTYQYGEYKIELKPTLGNFDMSKPPNNTRLKTRFFEIMGIIDGKMA